MNIKMESTQSSCSASADYYTDQAEKENVQHIVEKEDKKSKTKTPSKLPGITNSNKSSEKMCKEDDKVTTFSRFWSWFLCFVVQVRMSESGKQMTKKNQYTFLINAFNQQVKDFVQKDSKLYAAIMLAILCCRFSVSIRNALLTFLSYYHELC